MLFSRFYTLLSTLVTVNTTYVFFISSYFITAQTAFHLWLFRSSLHNFWIAACYCKAWQALTFTCILEFKSLQIQVLNKNLTDNPGEDNPSLQYELR